MPYLNCAPYRHLGASGKRKLYYQLFVKQFSVFCSLNRTDVSTTVDALHGPKQDGLGFIKTLERETHQQMKQKHYGKRNGDPKTVKRFESHQGSNHQRYSSKSTTRSEWAPTKRTSSQNRKVQHSDSGSRSLHFSKDRAQGSSGSSSVQLDKPSHSKSYRDNRKGNRNESSTGGRTSSEITKSFEALQSTFRKIKASKMNGPSPSKPFADFIVSDRAYARSVEISSSSLSYEALEVANQPPVPSLAHSLDRVLFSPGVHVLRDQRTNIYNFAPYLENIMSVRDFDFKNVATYVPSGKDSMLATLAQKSGKRYTGSTSSLTSVLTHFHHLLSHRRQPHTMGLSKFMGMNKKLRFSPIQEMPASVFLRYNPTSDTYAVDSDGTMSSEIIVSLLGHQLEAMLTTPEAEFEKFRKSAASGAAERPVPGNTYHYTSSGDFLMRSQLDCYDSRLPGTGTFDLKTRAVCAVRHDMDYTQIHDGSSYEITKLDGEFESFSREWFDLIRSTMFKYSLQARIGRMDGIFLAYHNVRRMFGFQYVPLNDMDQIYHTSHLIDNDRRSLSELESVEQYVTLDEEMAACATIIADAEFKLSLELLKEVLNKIVASHSVKGISFNLVFYATKPGQMTILVKPMQDDHIRMLQELSKQDGDLMSNLGPVNQDKKTYVEDGDRHTIQMHAITDREFVPPDVTVYDLDINSYVNDTFIPSNEHPHLKSDDDEWKVQAKITQLNQASSSVAYLKTVRDMRINSAKSALRLERLDTEEEQKIRHEELEKLEAPNAKQEYMRLLSARAAKLAAEREEMYGDARKRMWKPKD